VNICYLLRSFWSDAVLPADDVMTMTITRDALPNVFLGWYAMGNFPTFKLFLCLYVQDAHAHTHTNDGVYG